jgi:hypothetical protein
MRENREMRERREKRYTPTYKAKGVNHMPSSFIGLFREFLLKGKY